MKLNMEKALENLCEEAGVSRWRLEKMAGLANGNLTKATGQGDMKLTTVRKLAIGLGWKTSQVIDAMELKEVN